MCGLLNCRSRKGMCRLLLQMWFIKLNATRQYFYTCLEWKKVLLTTASFGAKSRYMPSRNSCQGAFAISSLATPEHRLHIINQLSTLVSRQSSSSSSISIVVCINPNWSIVSAILCFKCLYSSIDSKRATTCAVAT